MSAPAVSTIASSATSTRGVSTSVVYTENGAQHFGHNDKRAIPRYTRLARESKRYFLGPMPVDQFLDAFLVKPHSELGKMPSAHGAFAGLPKLYPEKPVDPGEEDEASASQNPSERRDEPPKRKKRKRKADGEEDADSEKAVQEALRQERKFSEESIYPHFVHALNPRSLDPPRCPGYIFCNTSKKADDAGGRVGAVKPDICCYATGRILDLPYVDINDAYTNTGLISTFIEVKARTDFFADPPPRTTVADRAHHSFVLDHIKNVDQRAKAAEALGQNIAYALEVLARQFRHCCYSVSVTCSSARLIRWDRAGAIVTEAIDLPKHPEILCKFFWCFSKLSRADQGYDLTVEMASPLEEQLFREAILIHIASQTGKIPDASTGPPAELRQHYTPNRVSRIRFTQEDHRQSHTLLVSRPIASPLSAFGRCTRGFWAVYCTWEYDHRERNVVLSDWEIVFLKDTWRYDTCADDLQEGVVLREMEGRVRNIPRVVIHEDVLRVDSAVDEDLGREVPIATGQRRCTETQNYLTADNLHWICGHARSDPKLTKHTQYRMVLNIVGYPLRCLRGTKELFHASYDAFLAMMDAANAGRLHRDITPANIILVREDGASFDAPRKGYLCDWDLARLKGYMNGEDHEVSATWQFQAIEVLRRRAKAEPFPHSLEYDMESMLYVVLHCALFFLEVIGGDPEACIENMFDAVVLSRGGDTWGGDGKSSNALDRSYTSDLAWACPDVKAWLDRVMELRHPITTPLIQRMDPENQWTAPNLNAFWEEFLALRPGLPLADRKHSHLFTAPAKPETFLSRFMRGVPNPAPVGYTVRGVVNKRPGSPSDELAPARNRRRIEPVKPTPEPEFLATSPSIEPPPSSVADSDDSDVEYHSTMLTEVISTSIPSPSSATPHSSHRSIDAYLSGIYGDPSTFSSSTTGPETGVMLVSSQTSAMQDALQVRFHATHADVSLNDGAASSAPGRRDDAAPAPPSHGPSTVRKDKHAAPGPSMRHHDRIGMDLLAVADPASHSTQTRQVPKLVHVPHNEEAAHLSRSETAYEFTAPVAIGATRTSVPTTSSRTSGRRRTRRTPGGY